MASQITSISTVCSTICSGADQWKHQSSASLVFVRGIHRWPLGSPHKGPVTRKMLPFDDVIMPLILLRIPVDSYGLFAHLLQRCFAGSGANMQINFEGYGWFDRYQTATSVDSVLNSLSVYKIISAPHINWIFIMIEPIGSCKKWLPFKKYDIEIFMIVRILWKKGIDMFSCESHS